MKLHANAALSLNRRRALVRRVVEEEWSLTQAAAAAEVSEPTARKWVGRYVAEGDAGLLDRPSAAHRVHNRTPEDRVQVICALRRLRMTGVEIAEVLEMPETTVSGILTSAGLGRLGRLGMEPAQRYERSRPGELIHIDVKKLGRISQRGAGHRALGPHNRSKAPGGGRPGGGRRIPAFATQTKGGLRMRKHLTYANVMVTLLAFGALTGGVAYAANTVFSTDIVDGQVKSPDLATNAVLSTKIADGEIKASDLAPPEPWHKVRAGSEDSDSCASGKPAIFCSVSGPVGGEWIPWQNYGGGYSTAAFYADQLGIVHLKGLVRNIEGWQPGADGPVSVRIFRLPPAYRPDNPRVFASVGGTRSGWFIGPGRIDVDPGGWVTFVADCADDLSACASDGAKYVTLEEVSFRPDE